MLHGSIEVSEDDRKLKRRGSFQVPTREHTEVLIIDFDEI